MTEHQDRDTRRHQILTAALHLFSTKGYENSSVDEIAKEAGLSKGSIYWYFKSKLEILFELTDRYVSDSQMELVRMADQDKYGPEAFYRSHRQLDQNKQQHPDRDHLFNQLVSLAGQHPEICQRLKEYSQKWTETSSQLIRRGIENGFFKEVDANLVSQAIVGLYDGLYMRKQYDPELDVVSVIETATRLMYEALTYNQQPVVQDVLQAATEDRG